MTAATRGHSGADVRALRAAMAATWLLMGAGHAFGPDQWHSSPSYAVIRAVLPLEAWGWIFMGVALLQAASIPSRLNLRNVSYVIGAFIAAAWGTSYIAAAVIGKLTLLGAPALWLFLAVAQVIETGRKAGR